MSTTTQNVLKLSILEREYEELLLQYKQIYDAYILALKGTSLTFSIASNSKYVGLTNINNVVTANPTQCKETCSATKLCNGANYNSVTRNCSLFSNAGVSPISPGMVTDFAIYSNIKKLNDDLNILNTQLVDKNNRIFELIKTTEINYKNDRLDMGSLNSRIETNYMNLYDEKQKINNLLDEFETYIEKDVSTKTEANRNYIIYVLLFFILIVILIILIKTIMS
jgi:hypothetical protein